MPHKNYLSSTRRSVTPPWQYKFSRASSTEYLQSLVGKTFIFGRPTTNRASLNYHTRLAVMQEDVSWRGGKILDADAPLHTIGPTYHVTVGTGSLPPVAQRIPNVRYLTEIELSKLITEMDELKQRAYEADRAASEVVQTPEGREMTLSTALGRLATLGSSIVKFTGTIIGPSGGVPYADSDEERDAVDGMI